MSGWGGPKKLTAEKVALIRAMDAEVPRPTQAHLAGLFGVSESTVHSVVHRKNLEACRVSYTPTTPEDQRTRNLMRILMVHDEMLRHHVRTLIREELAAAKAEPRGVGPETLLEGEA